MKRLLTTNDSKISPLIQSIAFTIALTLPLPSIALDTSIGGLWGALKSQLTLKDPTASYLQSFYQAIKMRQTDGENHNIFCPDLVAKFEQDGYKAPSDALETCNFQGEEVAKLQREQQAIKATWEQRRLEADIAAKEAEAQRASAEAKKFEAEALTARVQKEQAKANRKDARSCSFQRNLYVGGWVTASRGGALEELSQGMKALDDQGYTEIEQQHLLAAIQNGMTDYLHGIPADIGTIAFLKKCSSTVGMIH